MSRVNLQDRNQADIGIFSLIGISNFEHGPKADFFFFLRQSTICGGTQTCM